jgi:hypothetical protein
MTEHEAPELGFSKDTLVSRYLEKIGDELVSVAFGKEGKAGPGRSIIYRPLAEIGLTPLDVRGEENGDIEVYQLPEELHPLFLDADLNVLPGAEIGMKIIADAYHEWKVFRGPLRSVNTEEKFFTQLGPMIIDLLKNHDSNAPVGTT